MEKNQDKLTQQLILDQRYRRMAHRLQRRRESLEIYGFLKYI